MPAKIPPKASKTAPLPPRAASTSRPSPAPLQPSPSRSTLRKGSKLDKFKFQPPAEDTLTVSKKRDEPPGGPREAKRVRREDKVVLTLPEEDENGDPIPALLPAPVERARSATPPTPAQAHRATSPPPSSVSSSIELPLQIQARLQQGDCIESKTPRNEDPAPPALPCHASLELGVPSPSKVITSSTSRIHSAVEEAEIAECVATLNSDILDGFLTVNAIASTSACVLPKSVLIPFLHLSNPAHSPPQPFRQPAPPFRLSPHQQIPALPRSPAHRAFSPARPSSLARPLTPPRPSPFTHSLVALSPEGFSSALRTYLSARQSTSEAAVAEVARLEGVVRERHMELGRLSAELKGLKGEKEGWEKERSEGAKREEEARVERERLAREVDVLREVRRGLLGGRRELEKRVEEFEEKKETEGRSERSEMGD